MIATRPSAQSIPPTSVAEDARRVPCPVPAPGEEDLVAAARSAATTSEFQVRSGRREQRSGEIQLHGGEYRGAHGSFAIAERRQRTEAAPAACT
jgi:hypothetical protein